MTENQFAAYLADAVRAYADEHVRAGDVLPEEALPRAQKDYDELLPDGLRSPNQYLLTVTHDAHGAIGMIWYQITERGAAKSAYLYDIVIDEGFRGQGFARQSLGVLEVELRARGVLRIGLNVFGHNHAARALYEKLGYRITGIGMAKQLAPPEL